MYKRRHGYREGSESPVLAKDEGVERDQGEEGRILVLGERGGRDQYGGRAAYGNQRAWLCCQPAAQHHQIPCDVHDMRSHSSTHLAFCTAASGYMLQECFTILPWSKVPILGTRSLCTICKFKKKAPNSAEVRFCSFGKHSKQTSSPNVPPTADPIMRRTPLVSVESTFSDSTTATCNNTLPHDISTGLRLSISNSTFVTCVCVPLSVNLSIPQRSAHVSVCSYGALRKDHSCYKPTWL